MQALLEEFTYGFPSGGPPSGCVGFPDFQIPIGGAQGIFFWRSGPQDIWDRWQSYSTTGRVIFLENSTGSWHQIRVVLQMLHIMLCQYVMCQ